MKKWKIEYWAGARSKGPVEKWLDGLDNDQFKSVARELKMLEELGKDLKLPHSKPLNEGLFELRERRFSYRIYYAFCGKKLIVLLAAGNKQSQDRDIRIARERLLQIEGKVYEN